MDALPHAKKLAQLEAAVKKFGVDKLAAAQAAWEKSLAEMSPEKVTELKLPAAVSAALGKPVEERTVAEAGAVICPSEPAVIASGAKQSRAEAPD